MPPGQILPICDKAIGAGLWQPISMAGDLRRQQDAFRHVVMPSRIICTLTGLKVEIAADDIGEPDRLGFGGVAKLDQATFGTAVA